MRGVPERPRGPDPTRLVAIGSAVVFMVVTMVVFFPWGRSSDPGRLPVVSAAHPDPIPAEALVFRLGAGDVAVAPDADLRPGAQVRTLATYRTLRAYPGAPPRVPHGLTEEEFRGTLCNSCHQRGGFVERFGRYAPVTPHPEYAECLQCHAADAMRVGIAMGAANTDRTDVVCRQCHVDPDRPPPSLVALNWVPRSWPGKAFRALPEGPPVIPHDLQLRGNCLACHSGPGAVREIRTSHPERANCRQCHLTVETETAFVRSAP